VLRLYPRGAAQTDDAMAPPGWSSGLKDRP
jgi:hypothetical protein